MAFFDADKFLFVETHDGFLAPVHYRELGQKTNNNKYLNKD